VPEPPANTIPLISFSRLLGVIILFERHYGRVFELIY
jgi:hypothetical protein